MQRLVVDIIAIGRGLILGRVGVNVALRVGLEGRVGAHVVALEEKARRMRRIVRVGCRLMGDVRVGPAHGDRLLEGAGESAAEVLVECGRSIAAVDVVGAGAGHLFWIHFGLHATGARRETTQTVARVRRALQPLGEIVRPSRVSARSWRVCLSTTTTTTSSK